MSNKNFFNYIIVYIMSIAILGSMFIVPRTKFSSNADENVYKNERIVDFINGDQLISAQIDLYDFSENHFVLYELAPIGYAIYSVTEEASIFLEGSYESSSPYKEYLDNENYYTGPGNYYSETADGLLTIATNEYINVDSELTRYVIAKENYVKNNVSSFTTFPSTPDPTKTTTSNGMVVIKEYQYFKNLTKFPENTDNTCGLVAMSMLLGYFDEYVDSGFITDSSFKNGSGTSQALHDYLFANCLHLILGNDWFGHPMAGLEIKESMTDYLSNKCTASLRSKVTHEYGAILYTHATPRTHINAGYPTLLILTGGEYDKEGAPLKKGHVVPAYGYNEVKDTFLVHMGWWPNKTEEIYNFRSIIVSNATIHSYYTINYTA